MNLIVIRISFFTHGIIYHKAWESQNPRPRDLFQLMKSDRIGHILPRDIFYFFIRNKISRCFWFHLNVFFSHPCSFYFGKELWHELLKIWVVWQSIIPQDIPEKLPCRWQQSQRYPVFSIFFIGLFLLLCLSRPVELPPTSQAADFLVSLREWMCHQYTKIQTILNLPIAFHPSESFIKIYIHFIITKFEIACSSFL